MKFNENMLLLYAVTDRAWTGRQTLLEQIEEELGIQTYPVNWGRDHPAASGEGAG